MKTLTTCIIFAGVAAMSGTSFANAIGEKAARASGTKVAMLPPLATVSRPSTDVPKIRTIVFSNPRAAIPEDEPVLVKDAPMPEVAPAVPEVEGAVAKIAPPVEEGEIKAAEQNQPAPGVQQTVVEEDPLKMTNEELLAAMIEAEQRLNKARESLVAEQEKAKRERIRQKFAARRDACASDPGLECEEGIAGFPDNP